MNTKDRLIERLLRFAKRHKIFTYPVLALVAIISFMYNLFGWRNGAGKRVIAVVMVMVLFVSQSFFMTSSANGLVEDDTEQEEIQELLQADADNSLLSAEDYVSEPQEDNGGGDLISGGGSPNGISDASQENDTLLENQNMEQSSDGNESSDYQTSVDTDNEDTDWDAGNEFYEDEEFDFQMYNDGVGGDPTPQTVSCVLYYVVDGTPNYINRIDNISNDGGDTYNLSSVVSDQIATSVSKIHNETNYRLITDAWYTSEACNPGTSVNLSAVSATSDNQIFLYCKGYLAKYDVTIKHEKSDGSATPFSTDPAFTCQTSVDIQNPQQADRYGELVITDISRLGYKFEGASAEDASVTGLTKGDTGSVTLKLTGNKASRDVTLYWKPNDYIVNYQLGVDASSIHPETVYFDGSETFIEGKNLVIPKTGYKYDDGWKNETYGISVSDGDPVINFQTELYANKPVTLYPKVEYDGLQLNQSAVEFTYKDAKDSDVFNATYKTVGGNGDFTYALSDKADYASTLAAYGLTFVPTGTGFKFTTSSGGPKMVTSSPVQVEIKVTDNNAEKDEDKVSTLPMTITVKPCEVEIDLPKDFDTSKDYDGNRDVIFASGTFPTKDPNIYVSYDATKAKYNSKDVIEANRIEFPEGSLSLVAKNGESISNYKLKDSGFSINGSIKPIDLVVIPKIVFTNGKNYVRAGEADPKIVFEVKNSADLKGDDGTDWLENIKYDTTRPSDLEAERKGNEACTVTNVNTDGVKIGSNYHLIPDTSNAKFEVIKEETEEGINFAISGIKKTKDHTWYYGGSNLENPAGVSFETKDGYNTVVLSVNGNPKTYKNGDKITEDINSDNVQIYLLSDKKDGGTGAVTKPITISLKYDQSAPEYQGYHVTELGYTSGTEIPSGGFYFPGVGGVMDFGTYSKATLNIDIKYADSASGLKTLHYGLFGANPTEETFVNFDKASGVATIKLLADSVAKIGYIKCYAQDEAGNVSKTIHLSPIGDNPYEWSVESIAPVVKKFQVTGQIDDGQIVSVNSGREWYNHCNAELVVGDAVAGLHEIKLFVNDKVIPTTYTDKIVEDKTITQAISKSVAAPKADASYTVYAKIFDNAGNEVETDHITFKVDDVPPTLDVNYKEGVWTNDEKVTFTVSDSLSGVNYVRVTDSKGKTLDCYLDKQGASGVYTGSFQASEKGKYIVIATDKAGNTNRWEQEINHISNKVPSCPVISVVPATPNGENGWYKTLPSFSIKTVSTTSDGTDVNSYYQMWLEGSTPLNESTISGNKVDRAITQDGVYNVQAWSKSVSQVSCLNSANDKIQLKVDTDAPKITFKTSKGSGSSIIVNFEVTDTGSGVNANSVKVMRGTQTVVSEIKKAQNGCSGSFEIKETGNYTIQAKDMAGNNANVAAFTPMSMKVRAVTSISQNSATIGANVIKGTFDIASVNIAYRKTSDSSYIQTQAVLTKDSTGSVSASAVLNNLEENTSYAYKITAVSKANLADSSGEVLEYEGYFKTLSSTNDGISVNGTARYINGMNGKITVGLYEGSTCVMATEIKAGDEFRFTNVKDGNYNVVATDGLYSRSTRLLIENGRIIYPNGYISLVLSGKNTSVVVKTNETPNVTVANLDSIFEEDPINYNNTDAKTIEAGGTVEFELDATLTPVSTVSKGEIDAMYAVTDRNKVVGAYLDLSLYKIVTDVNGKVDKTRVKNLARGTQLSITIPLGALAGKRGLEVVRIHNDGDRYVGASLIDMDSNPSTYTISTGQFSTYAVLYDPRTATTEEVKPPVTDTVEDGSTAPSEDGDIYDDQYGDDDPTDGPGEDGDDPDEDDGPDVDLPQKPQKPQSQVNVHGSIGSLRSSGSAKTGDAAPIAAVAVILLVSVSGFVVLRRKSK
ncbi:MAG: hypothetical protein Q4D51_05355 [Eubacteriales bacterium]|nr:hypothetical protein [Eubacteriales bacterium]